MRLDRCKCLASANASGVPLPLDFGAEGLEREFTVVARADRLLNGRFPLGEQAGKKHTRFYLGAGDFGLVVNAAELTAVDLEGAAGVG